MKEDFNRYSRQILFQPIGEEGQERLSRGYALIVGCGAIGTTSASILARAGVGHLRIIDRDFLEESNLQRQDLFDEGDLKEGIPKAVAAEKKLQRINSHLHIEGIAADINPTNIEELAHGAHLILDCTDNFETRFLINDYSLKHRVPWIYAACLGSQGILMNILPGETPCLRCLLETTPPTASLPTCETAGILGPIAKVVGALQAAEAVKALTGHRDTLIRDLISIDLWQGTFQRLNVSGARSHQCPACRLGRYDFLNAKTGAIITNPCGTNSIQIVPTKGEKIGLEDLAKRLEKAGAVSYNPFLLRFRVKSLEMVVFPDGRTIVQGTQDQALAKDLYSKYIGM